MFHGVFFFFFSSRRRHTRCALVTGVQTCALPISPPSLTGDAAAEASAHRTNGTVIALGGDRRGEDRAAEILFEPVVHIGPELADLVGRTAVRIDLHHRAAVDHRRGVIGAVVQRRSEEHTSELQSLMRISYAV